jgi:phage baseplate assembly protein W
MSETTLTGPVPSFTQQITGYRKALIRTGDTLERIAQRELGDAAEWYVLASLNKLQPPWITDDPARAIPGRVLLSAQDSILIPSTAPPSTGVAETPNVFGRDCLLVAGQIAGGADGDILVVADIDNLKQALELRLGARIGDLVYHPTYGNRAWYLLGKGSTPVADQLAASWIAAACKADPRISAASFTATTTGDVLAATGTATAVDGKRLPIGLPGAGV